MRCEEVTEALPAHVKDGSDSLTVRRHLARCPDCKAELAQYEALMGGLRTLQTSAVPVPPGLYERLVEIPAISRIDSAREHVVRNRKVYVGGGIAVALAGALGAAVWRNKVRRPATA